MSHPRAPSSDRPVHKLNPCASHFRIRAIGFVLSDQQNLKGYSSPSCVSSEQRVHIDRGLSIAWSLLRLVLPEPRRLGWLEWGECAIGSIGFERAYCPAHVVACPYITLTNKTPRCSLRLAGRSMPTIRVWEHCGSSEAYQLPFSVPYSVWRSRD